MIPDSLPKTMRAAQAKDYGDIDDMISVVDSVPVASVLERLDEKQVKNHLLIKTLAVALSPGDCRVLSGKTREMQGPKSFPYTPGGDVCGIVVQMPPNDDDDDKNNETLPFGVGDRVAARFMGNSPMGALGEYALVHKAVCDKVPDNLSNEEAAALASATPALCIADRISKEEGADERILVMGAGGGVGSHLCQLLREKGKHVVAWTHDVERLMADPIGAHRAIDYTKEDLFAMPEFQSNPFDTVIDLSSGGWLRLLESVESKQAAIVKPASEGGRFLTTTPDTPTFEIHSIWGAISLFLVPALRRAVLSRTWRRSKLPKYTFAMSLPETRDVMTRTMELAEKEVLTGCVDGPYEFTTEGVRKAFRTLESRQAKGKVVIQVAKKG